MKHLWLLAGLATLALAATPVTAQWQGQQGGSKKGDWGKDGGGYGGKDQQPGGGKKDDWGKKDGGKKGDDWGGKKDKGGPDYGGGSWKGKDYGRGGRDGYGGRDGRDYGGWDRRRYHGHRHHQGGYWWRWVRELNRYEREDDYDRRRRRSY